MSIRTASAMAFVTVLTLLPQASAAVMNYTLTGYLQANANGGTVNAPFTLTATADTTNITHTGALYSTPATTAYLTINGINTCALKFCWGATEYLTLMVLRLPALSVAVTTNG